MSNSITYGKVDLGGSDFHYKLERNNYQNFRFSSKSKWPFYFRNGLNFGIWAITARKLDVKKVRKKLEKYLIRRQEIMLEVYRSCCSSELAFEYPSSGDFFSGNKISYLGNIYTVDLTVAEGLKNSVELGKEKLYVKYDKNDLLEYDNVYRREEAVISLMTEWYKEKAREIITEKVDKYRKIMDLEPGRVQVRGDMTRKYASCSNKGNLTFAWEPIKAPEEIVEYLVAHELTHLEVSGHYKNFWNYLGQYIDNVREKSKAVREYKLKKMFFKSAEDMAA